MPNNIPLPNLGAGDLEIVKTLSAASLCMRCCLRYLSVEQFDIYEISPSKLAKWLQAANHESFVCVICLGILQDQYCCDQFYDQISAEIQNSKFEFASLAFALSLPSCILLREHSLLLHLQDSSFQRKYCTKVEEIPSIKFIWKSLCQKYFTEKFKVPTELQKGSFEVSINFAYGKSDHECRFLCDVYPDQFKKRKPTKVPYEQFPKMVITRVLLSISPVVFKKNFSCPPVSAAEAVTCSDIGCCNDSLFLAGRYNKFSRELSQTPWIVDGIKLTETSIEDLIFAPVKEVIGCKEIRFSSSGREDVDVLMLGRGRPFVLECINPHRIFFTVDKLCELQKLINQSTEDISVRDLCIITRQDTTLLKEGETDKVKVYSAKVWTDKVLDQDFLDKHLNGISDLVLQQKTPIRVLHRRPNMMRDRVVHKISARILLEHSIQLELSTQAGTYIKEFVHGDFGRTKPNLGSLLNCECDVTELDVQDVLLEWPPPKIQAS